MGDKYVYDPDHSEGLGQHAAGGTLSAEMQELDLIPSQQVEEVAVTDDGGHVVAWYDTNRPEHPRHTTIDASEWEHFKKVTE